MNTDLQFNNDKTMFTIFNKSTRIRKSN